jgi:DNA-binding beta-propeller fold protein YncE
VSGFSPTALGSVAIPGFANEVAVNGNYAYVAAGSAGLQVVNVTNRSAPAIVASLALAGNANSVRVAGNLAFVAAGTAGLEVIDITNPLSPALRATLNTSGTALDVTVQGNLAYVANSTGLFLADVTNPIVPTALSSLPLTGSIRGISVDPQREIAVVAADTSGIYVVDVSNPEAPAQLGQLSTIDAHQVAIKGNYLFAADYQSLTTGAPYQNSVASIDISNPAAPTLVSAITNKNLGGVQNDLALSGNLALGACVSFLPNGVPITDITDPTNLLSRAILSFPQTSDYGTGIAVDGSYVYVTANNTSFDKFGSTANGNHLYIGQYQVLQDTFGIPPVATIVSPTSGSTVVQSQTIAVTVNATDDVAVAAVNLLVNGQPVLTDSVAPYVFYYTVPATATTLTLSATAVDYGGNVGTAPGVVLNVIPDPGTTVIGRVIDGNQNPLPGFIAQVIGHSSITAADGTFSIPNVPTVSVGVNGITVSVLGVDNGVVRSGTSATVPAVLGGTTNVGDIVTVSRPLIVGAVVAIDTSQNPPTTISTTGAFGANAEGISETPDGTKTFVSIQGYGSPIRVFDLTKNPPAYVTDISRPGVISNTLTNTITADARFLLAAWNSNAVTSIDTSAYKVVSTFNLPSGSSVSEIAVTPDSTTVILADVSDNVFRILSLSPIGVLSDTGKTIPYNFAFWTPNIAMAPDGHFALIANPSASYVSILRIDAQHNVTLNSTRIPISSWPWGIDFTPDGSKAYVTVAGSESPVSGTPGTVAVLSIDANDNVTDSGVRITIPNGIPLPPGGYNQGPSGIAIAVDGRAYVGNWAASITMVDTKTDAVIGTVAVPTPAGIAVPK